MTGPRAPDRSRGDRLLAAVPLASIVLWLAIVQMWETVGRKTPTIFTDELEWTQLSRSIADTGHPARRGAPIFFKSLYAYLLAPVWWISDTTEAYDAAKYLNAAVMSLAAVPVYLLARRFVSKPMALLAATATICAPAMGYGGYLIPEVLAYPWSCLCAYLVVESLAGRGRRWTLAATAACLVAPFVRLQLGVLPVAYAVAAFALWYATPRARRLRSSWTTADAVGAWLLLVGAFIVFNRFVLHRSSEWAITTEFWRGRMLQNGLWATAALAIGVGVLPLTATLMALVPARDERRERADRALVAFLASAIVGFVLYAALKGAYLSTIFATRVVERNMIYVGPLLFVGTVVLLERRRIRLVPLAAATACSIFLMAYMAIQLDFPYYEALGFSMLALGNRELYLSQHSLQLWSIAIAAIGGGLLLAKWAADRWEAPRAAAAGLLGLVAVLLVAWNLTGQIYASTGANDFSKTLISNFADPPSWVDEITHGAGVTYLGQRIIDLNGVDLTEFWNRSVRNVWSLDGSAPGPGPTLSPDLERADGTLRPRPPTPYALTDNGVELAQAPVAQWRSQRLYRLNGHWRLRSFNEGISDDGWMSGFSSSTYFADSGPGTLVVTLSRRAWCPEPGPPSGHFTIRVGRVAVNANNQPVIAPGGARTFRARVPNCRQSVVRIPIRSSPWRVETTSPTLFRPADYPPSTDRRDLSAIVTYAFRPAVSPTR